jgi:heme-degrading monooxygenase HmoA
VIVCIFRSRVRPGADIDALARLDRELDALVRTIPGFVSNKGFTAPDGEGVGIIEFDSLAAFEQWRHHPAHLAAKKRGRADFFSEFTVQVCTPFHVAGQP